MMPSAHARCSLSNETATNLRQSEDVVRGKLADKHHMLHTCADTNVASVTDGISIVVLSVIINLQIHLPPLFLQNILLCTYVLYLVESI